MLSYLRSKLSGYLLLGILLLVVISLGFMGFRGSRARSGTGGQVVASYGNHIVTTRELNLAMRRTLSSLQPAIRAQIIRSQPLQISLRTRVLNEILLENVMKSNLQKQGYIISPVLLNQHLRSDNTFFSGDVFSAQKFDYYLKNIGMTESEFIANLQLSLMLRQIDMGLAASSIELSTERSFYRSLISQVRTVDVYQIKASNHIVLSDKKIKQFYDTHQDLFSQNASINIKFIRMTPAAIARQAKVTDLFLKRFYNNHIDWYSKPEASRLRVLNFTKIIKKSSENDQLLTTKLLAGADDQTVHEIRTILKTFHMTNSTVGKGRWFIVDSLPEKVRSKILSLKIKQVAVVTADDGAKVGYQLMERRPTIILPFKQVKDRVKKDYINGLTQQRFSANIDRISDLAFIHPNDLDSLAKQLNLTITDDVTIIDDRTHKFAFLNQRMLRVALFPLAKQPKLHTNSKVLRLADGSVMVFQINSVRRQGVLPFKQVKRKVRDLYKASVINSNEKLLAMKVKKNLLTSGSVKKLHLPVKLFRNLSISRTSDPASDLLKKLKMVIFSLGLDHDHNIKVVKIDGSGYVVVKLKSIHTDHQNSAIVDQMVNKLVFVSHDYDYALFKQTILGLNQRKDFSSLNSNVIRAQ